MKVNKFGKGSTLAALEKEEKKNTGTKAIIFKWLPVLFLLIGVGLIVYGLAVEIGAI